MALSITLSWVVPITNGWVANCWACSPPGWLAFVFGLFWGAFCFFSPLLVAGAFLVGGAFFFPGGLLQLAPGLVLALIPDDKFAHGAIILARISRLGFILNLFGNASQATLEHF